MKRAPDRVKVTHVKGHATWQDVERGRTTMFNKLGNDGADALAVQGALARDFAPSLLRVSNEVKDHSQKYQAEILNILEEWQASVKELEFLYDKSLPRPLPE